MTRIITFDPDLSIDDLVSGVGGLSADATLCPHPGTKKNKLVAMVGAMLAGTVLGPHRGTSQDKLVDMVGAMPADTLLCPHPGTKKNKLVAMVGAMPAHRHLCPHRGTSQDKLVDMVGAMPADTYLHPPLFTSANLVAMVGAMPPGVYLTPAPRFVTRAALVAIVSAMPPDTFLFPSHETSQDKLVAMVRAIPKDVCLHIDSRESQARLVAMVAALPDDRPVVLDLEESSMFFTLEQLNDIENNLPRESQVEFQLAKDKRVTLDHACGVRSLAGIVLKFSVMNELTLSQEAKHSFRNFPFGFFNDPSETNPVLTEFKLANLPPVGDWRSVIMTYLTLSEVATLGQSNRQGIAAIGEDVTGSLPIQEPPKRQCAAVPEQSVSRCGHC